MKILFAASEAVPFSKTGGLGDAVGALVTALKQKRQDVRLILPKFRGIAQDRFNLRPLGLRFRVPLGDGHETVSLWEGRLDRSIPVYFIDAPKYFDRDDLYRDANGVDFTDNDERFILFSRSVLEATKAVDFRPDIIHCHDWQTGLVPAYLATVYRFDAFFIPTATVFTVHNIAYQGLFSKNTLFLAGLSWADFTPDRLEYYDQVNFLKAGLVYAHKLNTLSPAYAQEIQSGNTFGRGMEGILRARTKDFVGILNGLDGHEWDPSRDRFLTQKYSARQPDRRLACKADLQKMGNLRPDAKSPLLGMVSRLDAQNGFDLVLNVIEPFLQGGVQLAVLGEGEKEYQLAFDRLVKTYPGQAFYCSDFSDDVAHKIYAGCDIFLMPSRFEPCGLGQMIALKYGAVPVVTPTGGLKDTVVPVGTHRNTGVGFVSREMSAPAFRDSLAEALDIFRHRPELWSEIVKRGMTSASGWNKSAERYLELYRGAIARKAEENAR